MNVFDCFLTGNMEDVDLNLNDPHFNESLNRNSLNREDVINALLYEEVAWYDMSYKNRLVVYYSCDALNAMPMAKDHNYYKVVLSALNNSIKGVTIMPETRLFRDDASKHRDKQVFKAFSKRKRY